MKIHIKLSADPLGVLWRGRATSPPPPRAPEFQFFFPPGGGGEGGGDGGGVQKWTAPPRGPPGLNRPLRGRKNLKISPRGYFFQPGSICEVPGAPRATKTTKKPNFYQKFILSFFLGSPGPLGVGGLGAAPLISII